MVSEMVDGSRTAQKARTRQALLDAATALIREQGFEAATARAISQRAGVASGTFFVHFPEVAALVEELLDQHVERSLARAYRTLPEDAPLVDALVHLADALFAGYAREPDLARSLVAATVFRVDAVGPMAGRLADFRSRVLALMVRARATGELSPTDDLDVMFDSFFCLYFGLLVGGLRGDLSRHRQRRLLRSALAGMLGGGA